MGVAVCVGTRKGAFIYTSDRSRRAWKAHGPFLEGRSVFHLTLVGGTLYAGVSDPWTGANVFRSENLGRTWEPSRKPPRFPKSMKTAVAEVWHVEPGAKKNELWAGVSPAGLFHSTDAGRTWAPITGLNEHPTRSKWQPSNGGLFLHSISIDRENPKTMWVGISAVGVFKSTDGGRTWEPSNKGIVSVFLPETSAENQPEIGH